MRVAIIDPSGFTMPYDHCLATSLSQQGCQVVLAASRASSGPWAQGTNYERWEHFYRFADRLTKKTKVRTYLKGCEHPFNMERLLYSLQRWKPDVIHFQWVPLPLIDVFFLRRFRKIAPLILTVHNTEPFHGIPSSRIQLVGYKSIFLHFDHYIIHTYYSKQAFINQMPALESQISIIPHGVFTYYRELTDKIEDNGQDIEKEEKKKILFFGMLKPYKGVDVLLKAFARLPEPLAKETVLQIVGAPKMPIEPLTSLARRLNIENRVSWDLRFIEEKEVALLFAKADIVVLPYRRIDQSGVLMVALAFGKPIIASRVGGFAEIICDRVHGILVNPDDVESLTNALVYILENHEIRIKMIDAVKKLADRELSWNSIAQQTVCLYQSIRRA